jgi:hypothetical protein
LQHRRNILQDTQPQNMRKLPSLCVPVEGAEMISAEQWAAVASAPLPFLIALFVCAGGIWWALDFSYSAALRSKNAQIELKDAQIADYKDKLGGATPAQAKAEMDALKEKVHRTVGDKWPPLTSDQLKALSATLADLPKRRVQIMYSNYLGIDLARSIDEAFKTAGWTDINFSEGGGLGYGISTGRGKGMAVTIKDAIAQSTSLKPTVIGPDEDDIPSLVFVAVGINAPN